MFTIQSVSNLKWENAEHSCFSCDVQYEEFPNEVMPTGVIATDPYAHIQELWTKGNAGVYGVIAEYVAPVTMHKPAPASAQPSTTGTAPA